MNPQRLKGWLLPLAFACACAAALSAAYGLRGKAAPAAAARRGEEGPRVAWRVQMRARPNMPCACPGGWVVSDAAGGVAALSADGRTLWSVSFSNQVFDAGAAVAEGVAFVASQQGRVTALRTDTGERVWTSETQGRYQHVPLLGQVGGEPVLWLVSQEDGQLVCLRLKDGQAVWRGEPTNRCDGEPVAWQGRIAYGNCDGAVYVFDAANGKPLGSIEVGAEDQMAGGMLATGEGRLWAGTRQGNLVAADIGALKREAMVSVSQSEAFVTPVCAFNGLIAMGTAEGEIVFCGLADGRAQIARRVAAGGAVGQLLFKDGRLCALAGGALCILSSPDGKIVRLALGDEAHGLAAAADGALCCVADQAVVCIRGGLR